MLGQGMSQLENVSFNPFGTILPPLECPDPSRSRFSSRSHFGLSDLLVPFGPLLCSIFHPLPHSVSLTALHFPRSSGLPMG